jgi:hypothetical protein
MKQKFFLTAEDLAMRWGKRPWTILKYVRLGQVPKANLPGRQVRFDPDVILRLESDPSFLRNLGSLKTKENRIKPSGSH